MPMANRNPSLAAKLQDFRTNLRYIPWALRLVWAAAPRWSSAWLVLLVLQGVLPAAIIFLTKLTIDSLTHALGTVSIWQSIQLSLWLLGLTAGIMVITEVVEGAVGLVRTVQSEYIEDHITALVHRKSLTLDLRFYEEPEYHDQLEQVRGEASSRSRALLESVGNLVQNGITVLAIAAVLVPYGFWLPLVLFTSTLPGLYVVLRFDRNYHIWWQQSTSDRRHTSYCDMMITHSMAAAEVRSYNLGDHFRSSYNATRTKLRTAQLSHARAQGLARMAASSVALFVGGCALAWMLWRATQGTATLGDLVLFYQVFTRGQSLMGVLLGGAGQMYSNTLFLGSLFTFLELKSTVVDPPQPVPAPQLIRQGITFRDVTFRYPGSQRAALENFNLTVPAGKIVAIVGPNGAGKTTLVKLLSRFYDVERGSIQIDGVDIRDVRVTDLRRLLTVLFQFSMPYQTTADENIALGDTTRVANQENIEAAARSAGAHDLIARLPHGYHNQLGKWFADGAELSGGEWQRVATARAYFRQAPIIVLDEPTSAMDSWSEADWFERLHKLTVGRTSLVITHRFTIAMRADIIHVMDQGRIIESGTHHELLELNGLYARSWLAQVQAAQMGEVDDSLVPS